MKSSPIWILISVKISLNFCQETIFLTWILSWPGVRLPSSGLSENQFVSREAVTLWHCDIVTSWHRDIVTSWHCDISRRAFADLSGPHGPPWAQREPSDEPGRAGRLPRAREPLQTAGLSARWATLAHTTGDVAWHVSASEVFGGQSAWLEEQDRLLVCGGANWTASHGDCFSWSHRSVVHWSSLHYQHNYYRLQTWIELHCSGRNGNAPMNATNRIMIAFLRIRNQQLSNAIEFGEQRQWPTVVCMFVYWPSGFPLSLPILGLVLVISPDGQHLYHAAHCCRTWGEWRREGELNYPRAFGYMTYLPEPLCKVTPVSRVSPLLWLSAFQTEKLFIVGGLDSVSLDPILTTEVWWHSLWLLWHFTRVFMSRFMMRRAGPGWFTSSSPPPVTRIYSLTERTPVASRNWHYLLGIPRCVDIASFM